MRASVRREALRVRKARGVGRGRLHAVPVIDAPAIEHAYAADMAERAFSDAKAREPSPFGKIKPTIAPTDSELDALPLAMFAEYDLSAKEIDRLRRRLYARNKTGKFFFRTTRFGGLLAVVRFM